MEKRFKARPLNVGGKWRVEVTVGLDTQCIGNQVKDSPLFKWLEFETEQGAIDKINNDDRLSLI